MSGTGPDEYDQLVSRDFGLYSRQHRQIYEIIVGILGAKPADVLEIGTGIGYGLKRFLQEKCIKSYLGIEPSKKCFTYLSQIFDVPIMNKEFMDCTIKEAFDFTVCIEVLEHIIDIDLLAWCKKIREHTKIATFISTPDATVDSHGTLTKEQVREALYEAGFKNVVSIEWQKPHLFFIGTVE